jgi:hypothetical protein
MEQARATWNDARLDDLSGRVDDLGRRMDSGFNRVDADMRELRGDLNALRSETNARFDSLQRTMLQLGGGMIVTFVVGFASLLAAQLA